MVGIVSLLTPWAKAQPSVTVHGTLKGYFLTPQGELVRRKITLTSSPVSEPPKEQLHLLWAGYYFEGLLESNEPVVSVRIFLGDVLIYPRRFPKPTTKVALPDWKIPLRVHPRYGFPPIIQVEGLRGWKEQLRLQPIGVKILSLLPLKVDWMDFVRIELIRRFLEREGDQLFPGWRLEGLTFVMQGEDGQIVWINPPKPPKGSKRYLGPCPTKGRIYYGAQRYKIILPHQGGVTKEQTVYLSYRPNWYALPEAIEDDPLAEELDNLLRLEVIFHETLHALVWRRYKNAIVTTTDIQNWQKWWNDAIAQILYDIAYETISSLVAYGVGNLKTQQMIDSIKTFLAVRWQLKRTHPEVFRIFASEELLEGIALCTQRVAITKFMNSPEGQNLLELDPFLKSEASEVDETFTTSIMAVENKRAQCGAYALKVAEKLGVDWRSLIAKQLPPSVDELLAQFVFWENDQEKSQIVKRVMRERVAELMPYKNFDEQGWQLLRAYLKGELVKIHIRVEYFASGGFPKAPEAKWQWLSSLNLVFDPAPKFSIQRPVLASNYMLVHYLADFCFFLEPTEVLLIRWHGDDLEVKGKGVMFYVPNARIIATRHSVWLLGSLALPKSFEAIRGIKKGVSKMQRAAWFALPLALLLAAPAAGQYMADQTFTCMVSGLFHDVLTGQQQYLTLDLVDEENNPPGDWHCIAGETYSVHASWTSPRAELAELTLKGPDGSVLATTSSDPPSKSLTVSGQFQPTQNCTINVTIGAQFDIKQPVTGKITGGIQICLNPPTQGMIKVIVQDANTGNPVNPPYKVTITKKPSGSTRFALTDSSGIAVFSDLDPGDYIVTLEGINNLPACKWTSEWQLKKRGSLEIRAAMAYHRPIEGRIKFVGGSGSPNNVTVKAVKGSIVKYGQVSETPDPNGYYHFQIPVPGEGGIPEDGVWTVIVEYPNGIVTPSSKSITVPRHCHNVVGMQPPYGSHLPIDAGVFEIQVQPPQPPPGNGG